MSTHTMKLVIKDGCILNLPVYEPHKSGKNWFAIIVPAAGGKYDRKFIDKAQDAVLKYPAQEIKPGQMIEFGADMIRGKDRIPRRWYGIVQSVSDTAIEAQEFQSAEAMLAYNAASGGAATSGSEPRKPAPEKAPISGKAPKSKDALLAEKRQLLLRLGEIEFELYQMQ